MAHTTQKIKGGFEKMNYSFPVCRQQKQFEDLAKNIIKMLSDLTDEQQNDLH